VKDQQRGEMCAACGTVYAAGGLCPTCNTRGVDPVAPRTVNEPPAWLPPADLLLGEGSECEAVARPTVLTMTAPKMLAVGAVLGAGVRGLCVAGGLDEVAAGELETAVVEACAFAVANGTNGDVRLEVEIWAEGCGVCVSDEGPAWPWPRPSARTPDLESFTGEVVSPEARAFLIRSSVDEASFERNGNANRLSASGQARARRC